MIPAGLRQPDPRSCGAASVVMARVLHDGRQPTPREFRDEVLRCHRRLTSARHHDRWQVPWPRVIGTPPWAVRRELEDITGVDHDVHLARWSRPEAFDRLLRVGGAVYVGSRALPRHVLMVLAPADDRAGDLGGDRAGGAVRCYQPSRGTVIDLTRDEFVGGRLGSAGWPYPWFTVSPSRPA